MTYYALKNPQGDVLPLFIGTSEVMVIRRYTNTTAFDAVTSHGWKSRLEQGFSVVPVRVTIEEIKP